MFPTYKIIIIFLFSLTFIIIFFQNLENANTSRDGMAVIRHSEHNNTFSRKEITSGQYYIEESSPCAINNVTVDCSWRALSRIQSSWFPNNTEVILLNNNKLQVLPNFTFFHLPNLKQLDLSENNFQEIEANAFQGLEKLEILLLYQTNFTFTDVEYVQKIFKYTHDLIELNIIQNTHFYVGTETYTFLAQMARLERLSIEYNTDVLYLGSEFKNMTNLKYLKLVGDLRVIDDTSFENVGTLIEIELYRLYSLNKMSSSAFRPLQNLKVLRMNAITLDTPYVLLRLTPFEGRNLTSISLDTVVSDLYRSNPEKEASLTRNNTKYLTSICLESFTLERCDIFYVEINAFINLDVWHNCMLNLVISFNPLYGNEFALRELMNLKRLKSLTLTDVFRPCNEYNPFPNNFQAKNGGHWPITKTSTSAMDVTKRSTTLSALTECSNRKTYEASEARVCYPISQSIQYLNFRRLVGSLSLNHHYSIMGAENVEYIDISDSGFKDFYGIVEGLSSLKTFILSGNDLSAVSTSFFEFMPTTESLALSNCQLQRDFMSVYSGVLFKYLSNLKRLDLSTNFINYLSKDSFLYNSHLQFLNLSGNLFREIPFMLRNTPELMDLDLSVNSISTLDLKTTKELDSLVLKTGKLKLYLQGNVLSCGCSDLPFLQWMNLTLVSFDQNGNFSCINNKGKRTYTLLYSDLDSLWRECWGSFFLYFALILVFVYLIGICIVFIIMRNKQFIISSLLQIFGGFRLYTIHDYPIGLFIGYSDKDYKFPCTDLRDFIERSLKLRTFLIDRDLIASVDKASGIVDALNASWKILLVCSESFLKEDDWSMFTMRSAIYTQSPANPSRVLVLVHIDSLHLLPTELLSSVKDENIMVVSDWAMNYEMTQMLTTRLVSNGTKCV